MDTMAAWLFGLALMLVTEGECEDEEEALDGLLSESGGNLRVLEGAYGRGVALIGEYPDDPMVRQTVELLAKALRRGQRLVGFAQPA